MRKLILITLVFILLNIEGFGQKKESVGWLFWNNTVKMSEKFDLLTDVQVRSADRLDYLTTLLSRVAVSYNLSERHSAALGYAFKGDWEKENSGRTYSLENRIYQQYVFDFKVMKVEANARARLEQRFVSEDNHVDFSQRARAFFSMKVPLLADTGFTKGIYAGLQNEVFLNVQNKDRVNGKIFDQNRSLVSLGYRFSKKIEAELGYMYLYKKESQGGVRTNVWQLMLTTDL